MGDAWGPILFILLVGCGFLAYNGTFYTTGRQWYENCYELKVEQEKAGLSEPKTTDPYKAAFWKRCELYSRRGIFNAGFVLAGNPERDAGARSLGTSCPSGWSDIPIAGTYYLTVNLLQEQGGPSLLDKFSMAEAMISRVYKTRWPNCASGRIRLGFPKIVEAREGVFDWETPCKRCETDRQ
jgi:hypothetical protein